MARTQGRTSGEAPGVAPWQSGSTVPRPAVEPPGAIRVALLSDARRQEEPGRCCWRSAIMGAFGAACVEVLEVGWRPVGERADAAVAGRSRPRLAGLPRVVRQPLVWTYRGFRRPWQAQVQRRAAIETARLVAAQRLSISVQLQDTVLVVAESADAAAAAVRAGMPARKVWLLARTADWWVDAGAEPAVEAAVVGEVGGLLTDCEPAREALERATSAARVRVEVLPQAVPDQACATCGRTGSLGPEPMDLPDWSRTGSVRLPIPDPRPAPHQPSQARARAVRAVLGPATTQHPGRPGPPRSTLVSGFDLKFARELAEELDNRPDLEITVDEWPGLAEPSPVTQRLAAESGSILAEWARPSAAWLAARKQPGQILIVRLHRYELDFPYPRQIDMDRVDAVVYVSPPIGRRIREELGWPPKKLVHIPNFLAVARFDRPKLPDARFGLGLVGMEWMNKRLDLALDLLAAVRREDRRFTLSVRSTMPWKNRYAWGRPAEREYVRRCFDRIEQDPLVRGAVSFDPPGRDMARWYRRVGHLLSVSDIESFHMAAAEGMASGAVPVIRPWQGAEEIYGAEWVHRSITEASAAVLGNADPETWQAQAARAKAEIAGMVDPAAVVQAWADLLHGDLAAARRRFPAGRPEEG